MKSHGLISWDHLVGSAAVQGKSRYGRRGVRGAVPPW